MRIATYRFVILTPDALYSITKQRFRNDDHIRVQRVSTPPSRHSKSSSEDVPYSQLARHGKTTHIVLLPPNTFPLSRYASIQPLLDQTDSQCICHDENPPLPLIIPFAAVKRVVLTTSLPILKNRSIATLGKRLTAQYACQRQFTQDLIVHLPCNVTSIHAHLHKKMKDTCADFVKGHTAHAAWGTMKSSYDVEQHASTTCLHTTSSSP